MAAIGGSGKPFNYSEFMSKCDKGGIHADAALNRYLETHPDADIDKLNTDQVINSYNTEHRKVTGPPVQSSFSMDTFVRQAEKSHVDPNAALNSYLDRNPGVTDLSQVKPSQIIHPYKKAGPERTSSSSSSGDVTLAELRQIEEMKKAEKLARQSRQVKIDSRLNLDQQDLQDIRSTPGLRWDKQRIRLRDFSTIPQAQESKILGFVDPGDFRRTGIAPTTHEKAISTDPDHNPIFNAAVDKFLNIIDRKEQKKGQPLTRLEQVALANEFTRNLFSRNGAVGFAKSQALLTEGRSPEYFRGKSTKIDTYLRNGIGVCRQRSRFLEQLLREIGVETAYTRSSKDHTWVEAELDDGKKYRLEPTLGGYGVEEIQV